MSCWKSGDPIPDGKRLFVFKVTYFKLSGKFYTEADYAYPCTDCNKGAGGPVAYMEDVVSHLRELVEGGGQGRLPGLVCDKKTGVRSIGWDGPVLVKCDFGYPVLIFSPGKK